MTTNNKYIIKRLAPWMIDELIAFSEITPFEVIFLRKQDEFYNDTIEKLKRNNIKIYTQPFTLRSFFPKLLMSLGFVLSNIGKFRFDYNGVLGLKSVIWFLRLDISKFSSNSKIHTQFATQGAIISLLIKKYFDDQPEYSFTFHAHDIYFDNRWFNMLLKNSFNSFSISEYNIRYVNDNYSKSEKIILSRLGVFRGLLQAKNRIKNDNEVFELGLISWFVEKKGIMYLLQAILALKKEGDSNFLLTLAGDGPLKKEYLDFIEKYNLNDVVKYIGKIKGKQKQDFFKQIDVFILPSIELKDDKDGIPVVIMEAIAASLPIISTNVSGIPEICINNYNGLLIEQKSVTEIVTAIKTLKNSQEQRTKMSNNSLILSEKYDIVRNSKLKIQELNW